MDDYGTEVKKLEAIFASALAEWSNKEMKNGVSSVSVCVCAFLLVSDNNIHLFDQIWDRIVEAISNRSDADEDSTHEPKVYGKTIDKTHFENEYVLADTYVCFESQDETKKIFDEHIEMQEFDADGFRNNPMLEDELKILREAMSKDGASSYHFTICVAVDENSLEGFSKARTDLSHRVDLSELTKEKSDWKAYLVDGYHRISVLLEEANRPNFPIAMRVIWLRTPTADLSWQVREYADTLNRVARVQPSFSIKRNTNPWFQIQIIESNISRIVKQVIEKEWPNTDTVSQLELFCLILLLLTFSPKPQLVRQKFIENEDNRHVYMLPTGQVVALLQYSNDSTDTFTKSASIASERPVRDANGHSRKKY
jgi:hypothetical protein